MRPLGNVTVTAPAKAILVGEHFVVAGCPAIALALDIRAKATAELLNEDVIEIVSKEFGIRRYGGKETRVEDPLYPVYLVVKEVLKLAGSNQGLKVVIESNIPPAAGLGSSAAVAVATASAVAKLLGLNASLEEITRTAYTGEVEIHKKPSGIDNTVSAYGGAIYFSIGKGFERLDVNFSQVRLVLADSGIQRSTGTLVARVLALKSKHSSVLDQVYAAATVLVENTRDALEREDFTAVGELMNINHGLLSAIGVSNAKLEELIYTARQAGALGAKITGAGGGGMILALCWREDAEQIAMELSKASTKVLMTSVSEKGVTLESG